MVFIRQVRTASGATAVQIAEYLRGRHRIVEHVGSAHTEAELGMLRERARVSCWTILPRASSISVSSPPLR